MCTVKYQNLLVVHLAVFAVSLCAQHLATLVTSRDCVSCRVMTTPSCVLGTVGEFDPKVDSISVYLERLELYFVANEVKDDRKVAVMLTVIGARTYDTLRSILAP